jgi:DNA-binding transcriptional LysR family regulator
MTLSLRALRSFIAVAEELHFGAAAARLHMTQPPLSQQIRQLESSLGTALFIRTTRSVQLTAAGVTLLDHARQLLADGEAAERAVMRAGSGEVGRLVLGFTNSATYRMLPKSVASFRADYPEVILELQEMLSGPLLSALRSRQLDVALVRLSSAMFGPGLRHLVVSREKMMLVIPRNHPLAQLSVVPLKRLEGLPFIGFANTGSRYFRETLEGIFASGRVRPRIVHESVLPTMLAMVEAGLGAALVPESVSGMRPELLYKPVSGIGEKGTVLLHCAWRSDDENPAVHNFVRKAMS